jgi:hypothetical protein
MMKAPATRCNNDMECNSIQHGMVYEKTGIISDACKVCNTISFVTDGSG